MKKGSHGSIALEEGWGKGAWLATRHSDGEGVGIEGK